MVINFRKNPISLPESIFYPEWVRVYLQDTGERIYPENIGLVSMELNEDYVGRDIRIEVVPNTLFHLSFSNSILIDLLYRIYQNSIGLDLGISTEVDSEAEEARNISVMGISLLAVNFSVLTTKDFIGDFNNRTNDYFFELNSQYNPEGKPIVTGEDASYLYLFVNEAKPNIRLLTDEGLKTPFLSTVNSSTGVFYYVFEVDFNTAIPGEMV